MSTWDDVDTPPDEGDMIFGVLTEAKMVSAALIPLAELDAGVIPHGFVPFRTTWGEKPFLRNTIPAFFWAYLSWIEYFSDQCWLAFKGFVPKPGEGIELEIWAIKLPHIVELPLDLEQFGWLIRQTGVCIGKVVRVNLARKWPEDFGKEVQDVLESAATCKFEEPLDQLIRVSKKPT